MQYHVLSCIFGELIARRQRKLRVCEYAPRLPHPAARAPDLTAPRFTALLQVFPPSYSLHTSASASQTLLVPSPVLIMPFPMLFTPAVALAFLLTRAVSFGFRFISVLL
jgi:hypothetical protein